MPRHEAPAVSSLLGLLLIVVAPACTVRSISNPARPSPWGPADATYRGELTELDVLGTWALETADDAAPVRLRSGQRLLVLQSGAMFPDEDMLAPLAEHFEVGVMSGLPHPAGDPEGGLAGVAARGGFDAVLCYWGVLESRERGTAGQAASWVPIVGYFVPDRSQTMRIRLKLVVLDVATGRWASLLPEPVDDERASSLVTRESSDREQVEVLKRAAYREAVAHVVRSLRAPSD